MVDTPTVIPTWRTVTERVGNRIETLRDRLERAPPESVNRLQGEIAAMRDVLAIPEIMALEALNAQPEEPSAY